MKKRVTAAMLTAAAISLLTACGGGDAKDVDTSALAGSLVGDIVYEDELKIMEAETIGYYIDIADGVESIMYMGVNGTTGEEVAVFKAPDEETAKTMEANVKEYLDDQKSSFEDYIPEAAARIDNAVLEQEGNYVVLCVSDDPDKAEEIIENAFK